MKHIVFVASTNKKQAFPIFYNHWIVYFIQQCKLYNPKYTYTIIADNENFITKALKETCHIVLVKPVIVNVIQQKIWQNISLPMAIRKLKATTVIQLFNSIAKLPVPQFCLQASIKNTFTNNKKIPSIFFKSTEVSLPNSNTIQPFIIVNNCTNSLQSITNDEAYFVAFVKYTQKENIVLLLKAFSLFKKRLLSNMHLIFIDEESNGLQEIEQLLETYKYRNSVHLLEKKLSSALPILSSAYAAIYLNDADALQMPLLLSIQQKIPCIVLNNKHTKYIADNAAIFTENTVEMVAGHLMAIYKNEQQHQQISNACVSIQSNLHSEKTIAQFFSILGA